MQRPCRRRESGARRDEGRRALPRDCAGAADERVIRLRLSSEVNGVECVRRRLRRRPSRRRIAEADEFYRAARRRRGVRRRAAGAASGIRRPAVEQAVLSLRRAPLADRRSGAAAAAAGTLARAKSHVDAPQQPRRDLDARHMGVSLVRGVGSRLPRHSAGDDRSAVREGSARAAAARMVHAPERPAARPTSGRSATSIRRCTPGRRCACIRSSGAPRARAT